MIVTTGNYKSDYKAIQDEVNKIKRNEVTDIYSVTLSTSSTSTVVGNQRCSIGSIIYLMPLTANAGALNNIYITPANKEFTIHHSSSTDIDLDFKYIIFS